MTSPLVAVDIGNSATKLGWFRPGEPAGGAGPLPAPVETFSFPTGEAPPEALLAALPAAGCRVRIASVNREGTRLLAGWFAQHRPHDRLLPLAHADLPIRAEVDFPERVGLDRLAAAVAASALRDAGRAVVVIGAGSAITVDLVTAGGTFAGGVILPGFRMSAEALFRGADLLPLTQFVPSDEPPPVVGKNTEAAIRSGLFWGAVGAVREIIARMRESLGAEPQILVTGGDLRQLARFLGPEARSVPNLVLAGIALADAKLPAP
jgi:type III pantothenate kinase